MALRKDLDPDLERFRDAIAVLRTESGESAGHLATVVDEFWSPSRPLTWQGRVWVLVTWVDGGRERIFEDYPPWTVVEELRQGFIEWERARGDSLHFSVEWLCGSDRERAWMVDGITADIGAYL